MPPEDTISTRLARWRSALSFRVVLPAVGLAIMLGAIFIRQPAAASYFGISLILAYAMPLVFVTMAQLFIMAAGDIDLGIGPFVSLVMCVSCAFLAPEPLLGVMALAACVLAYAGLGALIHLRQLPSIVATLGASFLWYGLALTIFPTPGGAAPEWIVSFIRWKPPLVPLPILVAIVCGIVGHFLLMSSAFGTVLRGFGGNPKAIARAGWSPLAMRVVLYAMAGVSGVIGGLLLSGLSTTGDANVGGNYTLQSIAAVIIGGGQFSGGVVSPIGAVMGALIILLTGSLLSFADISPNWQLSVQGIILIVVLSLRRFARAA